MHKSSQAVRFDALKVAVSVLALAVGAGFGAQASAQSAASYGGGPGYDEDIVTNHTVTPGPGNPATGANYANSPQVLDPAGSVNGIGQQIALRPDGFLGLCTGTLINPRTVITAAHCVNQYAAHEYGSDTGTTPLPPALAALFGPTNGIPISFGFSSTNRCRGVAVNGCVVNTGPYERWRDTNFSTQTGLNIYNGNQVWYDGPQGGSEFGNADIALVTLDTHADNIPTWTLLFSPLTGPTHSIITGYGATGVGSDNIGDLAGIDYRRRSAENMIDALMTSNDWVDSPAIDPGNTDFANEQHALYWNDFDDPDFDPSGPPPNFFIDYFDFNGLGGPGSHALPLEGSTAGGDSGGPLIVDQSFDRPVVAGVLTGSWSFNGGISTYGQFNVYPPLFLFWEDIVQNNPYIYARNRNGNRDWMNPAHWVQAMDPNYGVVNSHGDLVNSLPNTHQGGADGAVDKFGTLCFYETDCTTFDGPGNPTGHGPALVIPGGPGSTNFVPNNVEPVNSANPALQVRARYYDVTLSGVGETWLKNAVTIDRFTLDGLLTALDVRTAGTLNVWGDFNVYNGFLNVDGRINSGEALLVQGLLTGRGTFNPTFLTSVNGAIAPGGLIGLGTLTVQGDVVLASNNELLIELGRTSADQLRVTADPLQGTTGNISLGGDLWLTPNSQGGGPRYGNTYTIVRADGLVVDTFDDVNGFLGVLRPKVTYTANTVNVKLEAGSFLDVIVHNPALMPLALALDELRENHYFSLSNLYGAVDLMDSAHLTDAFTRLQPGSLMDAHGLMSMQNAAFGNTLQDRLSLLSRSGGTPLGLSIMGAPDQVLAFGGDEGLGAAPQLAFASMVTDTSRVSLPGGFSGFVSGGYGETESSNGAGRTASSPDDGLRTWNIIGGIEHAFGDLTVGIAGGYSHGTAQQTSTYALAENDLSQTAAYGVYRFDHGVYISGLAGYGASRTSTERRFAAGGLDYQMAGDVGGDVFMASVEGGVNFDFANGLTLTPNVSLRQFSVRMDGFTESGGETALEISERRYGQLEGRVGARLAGDFAFNSGWSFAPSLDVSAVSLLEAESDGVMARFAAASDVPFYVPGAARDSFWGEVAGGVSLVRGETSFSLRMDTSVGREEQHEDRYMARFAQRF